MWTLLSTDDESSGLYGFLNVIVHSASGLKQSLSKWIILLFLTINHLTDNSSGYTWCHIIQTHLLPPPHPLLLSLSAGRAAAGEQVGLARNTVYKPPQICLSQTAARSDSTLWSLPQKVSTSPLLFLLFLNVLSNFRAVMTPERAESEPAAGCRHRRLAQYSRQTCLNQLVDVNLKFLVSFWFFSEKYLCFVPTRPLLLPGGGFLRILCQQS